MFAHVRIVELAVSTVSKRRAASTHPILSSMLFHRFAWAVRPGDLGCRKESVLGSQWCGAGETWEMHGSAREFVLSGLDRPEPF